MLSKDEMDELNKIAYRARMLIYDEIMKSDALHVGLSGPAVKYIAQQIKEKNEAIEARMQKTFGNR